MNIIIGVLLALAILGGFIVILLKGRKKVGMKSTPHSEEKEMNDLDKKIKEKFKLFQGLRSEEEDQKILEAVQDHCFDEVLHFIVEKLSHEQGIQMEKELETTEEDDKMVSIFEKYLAMIPDHQQPLAERIDKLLDDILRDSMEKLEKEKGEQTK